jgi:CHAT domain-containing protein
MGSAQIQQLLDEGTLLLEYSVGDDCSYLWVVGTHSVDGFQLPPRAVIETASRRVYELLNARTQHPAAETDQQRRDRLTRAEREFPRAAAALSQMVLGPASALLGGSRLLVVSEGALGYVPFAVLPKPGGDEPLIARHEIVRLPSASVIAEVRREIARRKIPSKTVAIFADPVFDRRDERLTRGTNTPPVQYALDLQRSVSDAGLAADGLRIPRLLFSRREAQAIYSLAASGTALSALNFDASRPAALSPKLAQYGIIHFASHALVDNQNPSLSGIVLSLFDSRGVSQNGFLRLHDIYNLNLPADLVVLSACQTALGKEIRGEGLIGLTRGFFYAGAARVAASLWKVDDAATAELMTRFYKGLLTEHLRPAAALRSAQLWMRGQPRWKSPYYWAAFELQGDWK